MATFTYESIKNRFKNPTVDGNLDLLDDGAIIKIGADNDIQLSHSGTAGTLTILNGFTIDIVDDLVIDVDGGDIALKDAGTQFGGLSNSSGHLLLKDGTTTFLTGNGANATFAGTLATTGILTADAGINVDNITIDGTEIDLSSGDLTIDVAGDIILDAGGDNITLKDDGTQFGQFVNTSGNLIIKSGTTTAATFNGANVTFAGTVSDSSGSIASAAYPVGAVFIAVVSTNPSSLLGFGSWSAFGAGRMLVGFDSSDSDFDAAEETGGAKTHSLTIAELASHTHTVNEGSTSGTAFSASFSSGDDMTTIVDRTQTTSSTGSGTAHNNMPPYITVYMWKRTS